MLNKKIINDINDYAKGKPSVELEQIKDLLQKYTSKVEINKSQEMVNVILLVSMLMEVPEEVFDETVNRLNHVLIKKSTGLDPEQIMAMMESKKSNGPVQ